jgi:hypothetical protein
VTGGKRWEIGDVVTTVTFFPKLCYTRHLKVEASSRIITLLCVAYLVLKDMPPFAYYVMTLAIGIRLLVWPIETFTVADNDILVA